MKNFLKNGGLVVPGSLVASSAFAADYTTAITSAFTAATSNVSAATLGMVGLAALVTGVGLIISLIRK